MFVELSDISDCSDINHSVIEVRVITQERPDIIEEIRLSFCLVIKILS